MGKPADYKAHLARQRLYDRLVSRGFRASITRFKRHKWGFSLVLNEGDVETEAAIKATTETILLSRCLNVLEG